MLPNVSGTAFVTVTVTDNGGTANSGVNTVSQTFAMVVTAVNQQPTLNPIATPPAIYENATTPQTVNLSGISAGLGDTGQTLTLRAVSSNPALIANPVTVTYTSPNTTGLVSYTPVAFASGTATITVTVTDSGATAPQFNNFVQTFTVTVIAVDQAPTLNPIPNPAAIPENSGLRTVNLTGISVGPGDAAQTLTVTATSSNPTLIPSPSVNYTPNNPTGTSSSRRWQGRSARR